VQFFLEVGGEHAAEMSDRGAGLRTVREAVDIWEKTRPRQEKGREVGC
jgi:hypothetical protein